VFQGTHGIRVQAKIPRLDSPLIFVFCELHF
jgi:hypothetical protein